MGYLNKTCSTGVTGPVYGPTVGPLLRSASSANTWRSFTIKKVGETDQNEDLVEIKTSYPKSSEKPKSVLEYESENACITKIINRMVNIKSFQFMQVLRLCCA